MIPGILTSIIFLPIAGAIVILLTPSAKKNLIRWMATAFTFAQVILAVFIFRDFDRSTPAMQFVEQAKWIPSFNIEYFLGIDGLSVSMIILTPLLCFVGAIASWNIEKGVKGYYALYLLLDTGMMGVFGALDFFLFYVFWELMLLPMYFLIGIWGSAPWYDPVRKLWGGGPYSAIKFFLYTLAGSVLMLIALLVFYFNVRDPVTGGHTFNMLAIMDQTNHTGILRNFNVRLGIYVALFIAFAIKVPIFPFHTWLPDAHVEAPTAISVLLAGILLKMGTYAMMRVSFPMLPDAMKFKPFALGLALLGLINIVYGAFCAMAQKDLKRLVAYSSISHMGIAVLGMASLSLLGMNGAIMQMFNHGTVTAMLFLIVGVIYDRAHHREIDRFGGLAVRMPIYAGITSLAFFAGLGLPGLSSFISEAFCFLGAFGSTLYDYRLITAISTLGIVVTAGYFLWTLQRMFLGQLNPEYANLPEVSAREIVTLAPLGVIVVLLGVYPKPLIDLVSVSMNNLIDVVQQGSQMVLYSVK